MAWWALTPGGRTTPSGRLSVLETAGAQDAWFAALAGVAGLVVAVVWTAARPVQADRSSVRCLAGLLLGSLVAAVAAWGTGRGVDVVADLAAGSSERERPDRLLLTSVAALLVWPLVTAVVTGVDAARELVVSAVRSRGSRRRAPVDRDAPDPVQDTTS